MTKRRTPPIKRSARAKAIGRTIIVDNTTRELATVPAKLPVRVAGPDRVRPRAGGEMGRSGTMNIGGVISREDYNPLFDGKNGISTFDIMDRSDGQVGAAGEIIKMPIRAAHWRVVPPKDASPDETAIAEAAHEALFGDGMLPAGEGWDFVLRHLLMRVPFGFGFVEKMWMFDEDRGTYRYRKLAGRLPRSVDRFEVDRFGALQNIIQYASEPGTGRFQYWPIEAAYACLSVREREGDNYWGKSIYRRLYKHWYYKDDAYRIAGIRYDRYGVGVPKAEIEAGTTMEDDELRDLESTLAFMRSHQEAWVIAPAGVKITIMTPEGTGGADGLLEWIAHNDTMIVRGILATFLADHAEGMNTNRTQTLADIFLHALRGEANGIRDDVSTQIIRPYCDVNFDMRKNRYPTFEYSGIGDLTVEQLQAVLAPLVAAGVVTAEDSLEDVIRQMLGLGPLPEGWKRGDKKPDPLDIAAGSTGSGGTPPGGKKKGPDQKAPGNADDNQSKSNDQGSKELAAPPIDAIGLATAIADGMIEGVTAAVKPFGEKRDDSAIVELASSVRTMAQAVERSITAPQPPPPEMPPVIINMGGGRTVKKVVRDERGRITGVESDEGPIELYTGQPRDKEGQFAFGHRATGPVGAHAAQGVHYDAIIARPSSAYPPALAAGRDTSERHSLAGGKYTPERERLHQAIIDKYLHGKTPVEHPTAVVLGGGPASGKTSIVKAKNLITDNTVHVDADALRAELPEYREGLGKDKHIAAFTHEEASDISKKLTREAVNRRMNVLLDGTGDSSLEKLGGKVAAMRAGGHTVVGHYVTIDTDEAVKRANERGKRSGRYVPETFIRESHAAVSRTFPEAVRQGLFDEAYLYDNSGTGGPATVASFKGGKFRVHTAKRWQAFIDKGKQ